MSPPQFIPSPDWPSIYADTMTDGSDRRSCAACGKVIDKKPAKTQWLRRPTLEYWCWCSVCAAKHRAGQTFNQA